METTSKEISQLGVVSSTPNLILRLEGLALLAISTIAYHLTGGSWWMFAILFLLPDIGMLGYFINAKVGSISYNAVHTTVAPVLLGGLAWHLNATSTLAVALIWLAHIGFDRLLGYGLKYGDAFKHTHLTAPASV